MYLILVFLLSSLSFASILDNGNGYNDALFTEGFRSSGQASNQNEDIGSILKEIITDPDGLISSTFDVPDKLKGRVLFWANIYANYPLSTAVIHDKTDPSIVYDVLDLSYVFNDAKLSPAGKESKFKALVAERKQIIRDILKDISKFKNIKNFFAKTSDQIKIKKIVSNNIKSGFNAKTASENIRAQLGQKDSILTGLKNSFRYLPIIEDIFKESGLPWELTRIPFVESSFNIEASSKVGAQGIWQIMSVIGKKFMETKVTYDERNSPFKASAVAATLLKENYEILKSWPLAITAYNHGPGGLKKASKQLGTKDIVKIIAGYKGKTFGFASQNFYSEFLAALYVTVYYERIFGNIDKGHPLNFYYVNIEKNISVSDLSVVSGLTTSEISSYNPEFSKKMLKGDIPIIKGSKVKLPARASYKVEDYFVKMSDKKELERELNINESEEY